MRIKNRLILLAFFLTLNFASAQDYLASEGFTHNVTLKKMVNCPLYVEINEKQYPVIVNEQLNNPSELSANVLENFANIIEKLKGYRSVNPKIVGFKIDLCGERVTMHPFLGNNAK